MNPFKFIAFLSLLVLSSAELALASKHLTPIFTFACLDLNGIPILANSDQATTCCLNGVLRTNADPSCTSGPSSIGTGSFVQIANALSVAQNSLATANALNGIVTDQGTPAPSSGNPSTSAITASGLGTNAAGGSLGDSGGSLPSGISNAGSSGGGTGGARGGSGGGDVGVPSVGNTSTAGKATAADSLAPYVVAGYVKGNEPGAAAGSGFGNSFGSGGGAKATGDLGELKFGNDGSDGKSGADANGVDPTSITGSPNDALDYLSRIDKTANLFKIVSTRYTKETLKKHVGQE